MWGSLCAAAVHLRVLNSIWAMHLWLQLHKDSLAVLCIGKVAFFRWLNADASCVFVSRRAVHQHISVQLPDPGECGECMRSYAIKVVVKSEIVSYSFFPKNVHVAKMGKLQALFCLVEGVSLLYWVKVL